MIVAFFSDGPHAALAAYLTRTGLAAIGDDPLVVEPAGTDHSEPSWDITVDEILSVAGDAPRRDVLLALPRRMLIDGRLGGFVDLFVAVGGGNHGGAGRDRLPAHAWTLECSNAGHRTEYRGNDSRGPVERRRERTLPVTLPDIHGTGVGFARNGIPCAPPIREALLLSAVLQALAVDPDASDAGSALRDLLFSELSEGRDPAVDRARAIADRLDATSMAGTDRRHARRALRGSPPMTGLPRSIPPTAAATRFVGDASRMVRRGP